MITAKNNRRLLHLTSLAGVLMWCRSVPCQLPQSALAPTPSPLRAGEIRLAGRVRSVNIAQFSFLLDVSSFTTSRGRSKMTLPAKTKTVHVNPSTRFLQGSPSQGLRHRRPISLSTLTSGMSVVVIGSGQVQGQDFPAQAIILNAAIAKRVDTAPSRKTPDVRVSNFRVHVNGRSFSGTLVQVHLDTVRIKVGLGRNQVGLTEPLASMAKRHRALVGINGSYFQAYNSGAHKPPVMTLITNGQPVFTGNIGTTLGFTARNEARMDRATVVLGALNGASYSYRDGISNGDHADAATAFWPRVQEAVGCGPRLVTDGRIALDMSGEKFTDRKVLVLSTARSAVGLTRDRRLLLVTTSGTIPQLAGIMKALGAYQAMNLDGGASSGLWVRGHYLRSPGRNLSNCLLVLPR